MTDDPRRPSLIDLFREEARTQARVLNDGLLALDRAPRDADTLEACMRAAHSLKGAARIVGVQVGVELAHAMEDCFVAAQEGRALLDAGWIDELLRGVDIVARIGNDEDESARDAVGTCVASLQARMAGVVPHARQCGGMWRRRQPRRLNPCAHCRRTANAQSPRYRRAQSDADAIRTPHSIC